MGDGAWPFLVGEVICLVNPVNKRDLDLLNTRTTLEPLSTSQRDCCVFNQSQEGNNRSVLPLDVLGRHADGWQRVAPSPKGVGNLVNHRRAGDRSL